MYKKLLSMVMVYFGIITITHAQGTLTGTVTDASTGTTLPGVNVFIVESNQGDATDVDGRYRITDIPVGSYTIQVSYIGYLQASENITIEEGNNIHNVQLEVESYVLSDVVVTALGIRRSERSIGYAVQEVRGEDLSAANESNLVNALSGRTAGVQINSSSGQPGAGSRIVIRGNSSLVGNNQPLFVVDGVPISNSSDSNIDRDGATVFNGGTSNRGLDIDPSNIEEVSVLKGASATALYGSRAANGAVLITTKSGVVGQAPTVNFSTSVGFSDAYTDGYQTEYLGGSNGYYSNGLPSDRGGYTNNPNGATQTTQSWGPHKDEVSQEILNALGVNQIETFNPRQDFYQTGLTTNNSINLSGGTANSSYFFSTANINQKGTVPDTKLERTSFMARFNSELSEVISVESMVNYVNTQNRWLAEGNGAQAYLFGLNFTPINFDISNPTWEDGSQRNYTTAFNNPNWLTENNGYTSSLDRFIANSNIQVDILPWLSISERIGIDTYSDQRKGMSNIGTRGIPNGSMYDQKIHRTEINSDLTVTANRSLTEDFSLDLMVGNNISVRDYSSDELIGTGLNIPDFFHVSNANVISGNEDIEKRRLVSVYSQATLDYQNIVYLTLTARNDWSSTLPKENNSYFYPSASLGFVFSDAVDFFDDSFLSFGKIRASISQIGSDAPVYSLSTIYEQADPGDGVRGVINYPFNGVNGYRLDDTIGNPDLKPEISTEYEIGLDLRFFEGRGHIDVAYYDRSTVDQIFEVPTSSATGYSFRLANAGEVQNYGVELNVGVTPIETQDFQWDLSMNWSKNTTEIVEFAPGVENIFLGGFTSPQIRIEDSKNGYGVIWGNRYQRNDEGQLLIGEDGLPLVAPDLGAIGHVQPDWTGNVRTSFNYKGINVSALIDRRKGGDILNFDQYYGVFYGVHEVTSDRGSTYVYEGVNAETGLPNDQEIIRDQTFYQGHYGNVFENFVEDGSFLKLREISVSYTLPQSLLVNTPIQSLTISGTGRNLWIDSDFSYTDPEGSLLGVGNSQGFYHMVTPATRSYNFSVNVSF